MTGYSPWGHKGLDMIEVTKYHTYIQKTKIMASGPITSWQLNEETMEIVADFLFLVSKVTDGQGSLVCCSPWGREESDMTATELN